MSDEMEVQSTNLKRLRSDESETDLILHKMSKESKTKKNEQKFKNQTISTHLNPYIQDPNIKVPSPSHP